jgi:hypothetical protein
MLLCPFCQLEVFPGMDRQYVTQLLEGFLTNHTMDQALNMAMDHLLDNPRPEVVDVDAIAAAAGGEGWRREVTVSRLSHFTDVVLSCASIPCTTETLSLLLKGNMFQNLLRSARQTNFFKMYF